jgi:hypothetical protein
MASNATLQVLIEATNPATKCQGPAEVPDLGG